MAKEIITKISINAPIGKVWSVLTDFGKYPEWNPFIKAVEGKPVVGGTITVRLEPPDAKGMTFRPKVLVNEREKRFSWLGHLLFPGLFDGEHNFELIDNGNGSVTFIHSEKFGGILVPIFGKMLDINTRKGFELMNEKLKEISEESKLN